MTSYWESFMKQFNESATTDAAVAFAITPEVIGEQIMRDSLDKAIERLKSNDV